MTELEFSCTNCGAPNKLSEALAGPLIAAERQKAEAEAERRFAGSARRRAGCRRQARAEEETIAELRRAAEAKTPKSARPKRLEIAARKAIRRLRRQSVMSRSRSRDRSPPAEVAAAEARGDREGIGRDRETEISRGG